MINLDDPKYHQHKKNNYGFQSQSENESEFRDGIVYDIYEENVEEHVREVQKFREYYQNREPSTETFCEDNINVNENSDPIWGETYNYHQNNANTDNQSINY